MYNYNVVNQPIDMPACEHWALYEFVSVTIPGDQRSRDFPGHGYPESIEHYVRVLTFNTPEHLEEYILEYMKDKKYRVAKVKPLQVEQKTTINFREEK